MKTNNNKIDINAATAYLKNDNMHRKYGNLYLTNHQVEVLEKYGFDYRKYVNTKGLIFAIEEYLNENTECEDLDQVSYEISEFSYYNETNK